MSFIRSNLTPLTLIPSKKFYDNSQNEDVRLLRATSREIISNFKFENPPSIQLNEEINKHFESNNSNNYNNSYLKEKNFKSSNRSAVRSTYAVSVNYPKQSSNIELIKYKSTSLLPSSASQSDLAQPKAVVVSKLVGNRVQSIAEFLNNNDKEKSIVFKNDGLPNAANSGMNSSGSSVSLATNKTNSKEKNYILNYNKSSAFFMDSNKYKNKYNNNNHYNKNNNNNDVEESNINLKSDYILSSSSSTPALYIHQNNSNTNATNHDDFKSSNSFYRNRLESIGENGYLATSEANHNNNNGGSRKFNKNLLEQPASMFHISSSTVSEINYKHHASNGNCRYKYPNIMSSMSTMSANDIFRTNNFFNDFTRETDSSFVVPRRKYLSAANVNLNENSTINGSYEKLKSPFTFNSSTYNLEEIISSKSKSSSPSLSSIDKPKTTKYGKLIHIILLNSIFELFLKLLNKISSFK
jgi:hypothetical protein